jgi:hypothetical protein
MKKKFLNFFVKGVVILFISTLAIEKISYNKIVQMAIPFTDILQDGDLPVRSVGVYTHFNDIVFYALSECIRTERVKQTNDYR